MNRQLKRANEKSDKRREKEQVRRKEARRERVRVVRTRAKERPKASGSAERAERPGVSRWRRRFANGYLIFIIFFLVTQAFFPQRTDVASLAIHALFYAILGYFLVGWFYRRGTARAPLYTALFGVLLALGVEGVRFLLPGLEASEAGSTDPNLIFPALAVPGVVLGTVLGGYAHRRNLEV